MLLNINPLLPASRQMAISFLRITPTKIELGVRGVSASAACPKCGADSKRVHRGYPRKIADLPWAGVPLILLFLARRFFCDNSECGQSIFAEQLPELAAPRGRQTPRFNATLVDVGMECGGEAHRIPSGSQRTARYRNSQPGHGIFHRTSAAPIRRRRRHNATAAEIASRAADDGSGMAVRVSVSE